MKQRLNSEPAGRRGSGEQPRLSFENSEGQGKGRRSLIPRFGTLP